MQKKKQGFLKRAGAAFQVLLGKTKASLPDGAAGPAPGQSELQSRIGHLELDLRQRDERIAEMQKEFERQRQLATTETAGAGGAELLKLVKRVAPLLSQVDAMQHIADAGSQIKAQDLFTLLTKIEAVFKEAGLDSCGRVGDTVAFDNRIHQRMSGGDVNDNTPVKIRFKGYSFNDVVLLKAMVSSKE